MELAVAVANVKRVTEWRTLANFADFWPEFVKNSISPVATDNCIENDRDAVQKFARIGARAIN